jgi:hypothetical protein
MMVPYIADVNIPDERLTTARGVGEMQIGSNEAAEKALKPFPFDI